MFVLFSRVFFVTAIFLLAYCFNQTFLTPKDSYILHLPIWETYVYGLKSQTITNQAFWSSHFPCQVVIISINLPSICLHWWAFAKNFDTACKWRFWLSPSSGWPLLSSWIEVTSNAFFFPLGKRCFQCWVLKKLGGHCCEIFQIFEVLPLLVFILIFSDHPQLMRIRSDQQHLFFWRKKTQCFLAVVMTKFIHPRWDGKFGV